MKLLFSLLLSLVLLQVNAFILGERRCTEEQEIIVQAQKQIIIKYIHLSSAAYCVTNRTSAHGYARVLSTFYNTTSKIRGYVAVNTTSREITISFRGTTKPTHWKYNLQFVHSVESSGKVHQGFLKAYKSVQPQVEQQLRYVLKEFNGFRVNFVGHSLGGALATLAIEDALSGDDGFLLDLLKPKDATLATVGAPRVGDEQFVKSLAGVGFEIYRIVNDQDPIPLVPPRGIGYRHLPGGVLISDQHMMECDELYDCKQLKLEYHGLYLGIGFSRHVHDCEHCKKHI